MISTGYGRDGAVVSNFSVALEDTIVFLLSIFICFSFSVYTVLELSDSQTNQVQTVMHLHLCSSLHENLYIYICYIYIYIYIKAAIVCISELQFSSFPS